MNTTSTIKFIIEDKNTIMNNYHIISAEKQNSRKRKVEYQVDTPNKKPKETDEERNALRMFYMQDYFGRAWIEAERQFNIDHPLEDDDDLTSLIKSEKESEDKSSQKSDDSSIEDDDSDVERESEQVIDSNLTYETSELFPNSQNFEYYNYFYLNSGVIDTWEDLVNEFSYEY
jgi:hypothetical protein